MKPESAECAHTEWTIEEVAHGVAAYWETVALRSAILRAPLGLQFSAAELAAEATSHHLVCRCGTRLLGCLVLKPAESGEIRMRQVAVVPEWQRRGIGAALVRAAEALALRLGYQRMTLHARATAVAFYEKLGYTACGEPFEEVTIPHQAMLKWLVKCASPYCR